jgi:hypothetical protein
VSSQQDDADDPRAALPGLIGKWRDNWSIRYEGGMFRAYGRDHDGDGKITYRDTEIAASTADGLDRELAAWESAP